MLALSGRRGDRSQVQILKNDSRPPSGPATTAAYLRVLVAFFRSARPADYPVTKQIIANWKPYKHRKRERPHYYTDDEFQRILKVCDAFKSRKGQRDGLWWKTFITPLHDCGVRMNEAAHLIWRDVDFEAAELRIASHVNLKGVFPWRPKCKGLPPSPLVMSRPSVSVYCRLLCADHLPFCQSWTVSQAMCCRNAASSAETPSGRYVQPIGLSWNNVA